MPRLYRANGDKIRAFRERRGLTQEQLAILSQRSVPTIQSLEKGNNAFLSTFSAISPHINAKPDDLYDHPVEIESSPGLPPPEKTAGVYIRIDVSFDGFDETDQLPILVKTVMSIINAKYDIDVDSANKGSVSIILRLHEVDVFSFVNKFIEGELSPIQPSFIAIPTASVCPPPYTHYLRTNRTDFERIPDGSFTEIGVYVRQMASLKRVFFLVDGNQYVVMTLLSADERRILENAKAIGRDPATLFSNSVRDFVLSLSREQSVLLRKMLIEAEEARLASQKYTGSLTFANESDYGEKDDGDF